MADGTVDDRIKSRAERVEAAGETVDVELEGMFGLEFEEVVEVGFISLENVEVGGGVCVESSFFFNMLMLCSCEDGVKENAMFTLVPLWVQVDQMWPKHNIKVKQGSRTMVGSGMYSILYAGGSMKGC